MFKLFAVSTINKFTNPIHCETDKKNVYLLGQGWFSKGFMDNIDRNKYNINNFYKNEFTNTAQCIVNPEIKIPFNYNVNNFNETITNIDIDNKILTTDKTSYNFSKDILVCGIGDNTPVNKWLKTLENVKTYGVIGAGLVGTELAFKLMDDKNKKVTIFDGLPTIHDFLPISLKEYVAKEFENKDIKLHINQMYNMEPFDKVIFATGSRPNDITKDWLQDKNLQLIYNGVLQDNIYFGGNCVWNTDIKNPGPPTAQRAYDQGKHIAIGLNTEISEYKVKNFIYSMYVGDGFTALYMNNCKYYIILPTSFINLYYKLKYGTT